MLNILHVIESLEFGGAEKVVVHLANKLCHDYNITICVTKRSGELCDQLDSRVKVICLYGKEGNDLSIPFKLSKIIKSKNIDILHTHDWGVYLEAVFASILSRKSKLIHTVHGNYIPYSNSIISKIKKYFRHLLENIASHKTYKIVPVSDSIKQYIENEIHIRKNVLQIIHNGIEGHNPKEYNLDSVSTIKLITVGRLAVVKNHKVMIDAVKCVISKGFDVTLTIVGDGPEYDVLSEYVENSDLNNNISFLGFRTDIAELLSQHHIFVLSSEYEGISIALLEAMSIGMPTISTNVGGIPDTVEDEVTGLLVKKGDSNAMCAAIINLVTDFTKLTRMSHNAHQCFLKKFHENVVLEKYRQLYQECNK